MKKYTQLNTRNRKNPTAKKVQVPKLKLKKGDNVLVVSGKDKGKTGKIVRAFPMTGKVVIEGVAIAKRHLSKVRNARGASGQSGRIIEISRPIDASNVMLVDPKTDKPTRIGRTLEKGALVRVAKKSGTTLS